MLWVLIVLDMVPSWVEWEQASVKFAMLKPKNKLLLLVRKEIKGVS